MMVEAYTNITNTMKYYGNATHAGAHFPFNFGIINNINNDTNAAGLKGAIDEWFAYMPAGAWANWVVSHFYKFHHNKLNAQDTSRTIF